MKKRTIAICLALLGLLLIGLSVLAALNWETVSRNVGETVERQSERAGAALFRLGELMSIEARLKEEYGVAPQLTYDTEGASRVLHVTFTAYILPRGMSAGEHSREIAAFAIRQTKKAHQIDLVRVSFTTAGGRSDSHGFAADELIRPPG